MYILSSISHLFFFSLEETLHIYIIHKCCGKAASYISSWINHPHLLSMYVFISLMFPWLVNAETHYWVRCIGTKGYRERRTKGGTRRRSLMSFDLPPAVLAQSADTRVYTHLSAPITLSQCHPACWSNSSIFKSWPGHRELTNSMCCVFNAIWPSHSVWLHITHTRTHII